MYSLYPVFNDLLLFLPINEIEKCQLVKVSWWDSIDRNWKSLPRRILSQITIGQECLAYANFSDDVSISNIKKFVSFSFKGPVRSEKKLL